jgi:ketosteroid isomerase-like protein
MRFAGIAGWAAAALLLAGTAQAQDARAAIEAATKGFQAAYEKHDAEAVASFYSSTAEAFPPGGEIVKGRDALAKLWQGVMDSGIASAALKTTEVHAEGNLAYEVGTYAMKTKDGTVADHGKYCAVWLKEGGQWKLHRDIWNTSVPPPPPPAPAPKKK